MNTLNKFIQSFGKAPNQVTDVYKVRRGRWVDVRIWSYMDLGTCRKEDLFITDANFNPIEDFSIIFYHPVFNNKEEINQLLKKINISSTSEVSVKEEEKPIKRVSWDDLL